MIILLIIIPVHQNLLILYL